MESRDFRLAMGKIENEKFGFPIGNSWDGLWEETEAFSDVEMRRFFHMIPTGISLLF